MKILLVFILLKTSLFLHSCSSPAHNEVSQKKNERKLKLDKEISTLKNPVHVKGEFSDYLYLINPAHKQKGYGFQVTEPYGYDGYALAYGPYDGQSFEYYLFRGFEKDFVLEIYSTTNNNQEKLFYGSEFLAYLFRDNKMSKVSMDKVFPRRQIQKLFSQKIKILKKKKEFQGWKYFEFIKPPAIGGSLALKVCKDDQSPYFDSSTQTTCTTIGFLKFDKKNFSLKPSSSFSKITKEII